MRYKMKQKFFSIGDDFVVENEQGQKVFYIDAKKLAIGDKLVFQDMAGTQLALIRQKLLSWGPKYLIYKGDEHFATISKAWSLWGLKLKIDVPGPNDYVVKGKLLKREYQVIRGGETVATVSKKWFTLTDTYGVDVRDGEDHVLILASVVAIDLICAKLDK